MAAVALGGGGLEIHVAKCHLHVGRLMTIDARNGAMPPDQRKRGRGMIKPKIRRPGFSGVASFASGEFPIGPQLFHTRPKLAMMRIGVALRAGERLKSIGSGTLAAGRNLRLVAFDAGGGHVAARQGEPCGLMSCQREGGRRETLNGVAVLALVVVRSSGKLTLVDVGMTILASRFLDLVHRLDACGHMALGAGHLGVLALQGVACRCMLLDAKCGRLESVHGMAFHTITAVFSRGELASVRIFVAVQAPGESDWAFEVSTVMALRALHRGMFPEQRILCPGVVKM